MLKYFNDEIDLLLQPGVLGFYDRIEVIEIFSIDEAGAAGNILTLMIAEESGSSTFPEETYLTDKLIKVNSLKKWRFGIKKYYLSLEQLSMKVVSLTQKNPLGNKQKEIRNLIRLDKKFSPPNSYEIVPLNNILKNNFHNGSYLIEWLDKGKENHLDLLLDPISLNTLSEEISKILPIFISPLSDRIGNFILQIPVDILISRFGLSSDSDNYLLNCKIAWHMKSTPRDLIINCRLTEEDKLCDGYHTVILSSEDTETIFPITNARGHIGTVWDPENNLILSQTRPSAFITPRGKITTSVSVMKERILPSKNGEIKVGISVPDNRIKNMNKIQLPVDWTEQRIYENDSDSLKKSRKFVQYNPKGKDKTVSKKDALADLLYLISEHGANSVWLWDPYLNDQDIFSTLLFNRHSQSSMRAITSLELPPNQEEDNGKENANSKNDIIECYKNKFNEISSESKKTFNFEFRCKVGNNGWSFHDRFIIFPGIGYQQKTKAWSLGTSVNSFGTSHHILQQVTDAQLIANAFMELWDSLSKDECLIWRNINE